MVQVVRNGRLVQMKGGVDLCTARHVRKLHILGNAIRPGKRPKVMVKGYVFLDDVDEVFDGNVLGVLRPQEERSQTEGRKERGGLSR